MEVCKVEYMHCADFETVQNYCNKLISCELMKFCAVMVIMYNCRDELFFIPILESLAVYLFIIFVMVT